MAAKATSDVEKDGETVRPQVVRCAIMYTSISKKLGARMAEVNWEAAGDSALDPVAESMRLEYLSDARYSLRSQAVGVWSLAGLVVSLSFIVFNDKAIAENVSLAFLMAANVFSMVRSYRARRELALRQEATLAIVDDLAHLFPRHEEGAEKA